MRFPIRTILHLRYSCHPFPSVTQQRTKINNKPEHDTEKHTHDHTSFVKFVSYLLFLLRSKTRHDRFGRTSSCVCFFFFLLLLFFLSLSSFLATYSSISRPSPLLLSLNALPSPSFLVLVEPPLQFSTISSRLQDSIDEDTLHNLPLSLVSPPKKNEEKTGRNIEKDIQFFFLLSFSAPTHIPSNFCNYDCAPICCVKCSLARPPSLHRAPFLSSARARLFVCRPRGQRVEEEAPSSKK